MSTSEQNGPQLTRKQLREIRLTGSTPVITEEAVARSEHIAPPAQVSPPAPVSPPAQVSPPASTSAEHAPLTRREMREQERARTASAATHSESTAPVRPAAGPREPGEGGGAVRSIFGAPAAADALPAPQPVVAGVPRFGDVDSIFSETPATAGATQTAPQQLLVEPALSIAPIVAEQPAPSQSVPQPTAPAAPAASEPELVRPLLSQSTESENPADEQTPGRPQVGASFGIGVKDRPARDHALPKAFDDLIENSSTGSQKNASTLIFTPSPGVGSLSGPIASTGDLLVTGSYKLPEGLGSHGHADGTTDGKEADAVLIDGELAPTSSPTPIAASSAISTLKPAAEVIRPPAPDRSGKLTLTLAIVAGGLGLALAAVIAVAALTGVFS